MIKLCIIDTETTGLFAWSHGIIQIAFYIVIDNEVKEKVNIFVNPFPEDKIEDKALEANGRDRDTLFNHTPPKEALKQIETIFSKYVEKTNKQDKFFFLAYNAPFDEEFLRKWWKKCGSNFFGSWFFSPIIDVMGVAAIPLLADRPNMENFKLGTVAHRLGITPDGNLHDALIDVDTTWKIWLASTEGDEAGETETTQTK